MCKEGKIYVALTAIGILTIIGVQLYTLHNDVEITYDECIQMKHEYKDLMFMYKSLDAERHRLEYELQQYTGDTPEPDIGEPWSTTTPDLPYYVPVDIQEPLPYIA